MNTTISSSLLTKHLSTNVYPASPKFRTKLQQVTYGLIVETVISAYLYDNKVVMWRQIFFGANSSAASPS